ncbi:hypothetical protein [Latilactobacillus sakei]|uniref:hypothetical protein n=4 Tax=Latilactobacillus sakei TaxID=1599 RepID=UPI00077C8E6A|nr:hypothetical protein [Latilactobacillus sakei]MDM5043419.1 hypothetical protein [Latilactobacillus sakei]QPG03449.1 hypothetical protein INH01_00950 [Latilactobacillus sakei]USF97015.1 hypothetical protein A4W82_09400 [Latilactobacillus sakei]
MIKSTKMVSLLLTSSTVLGLMVSTGVATVRAAENSSVKTEQKVNTKAKSKIADPKAGIGFLVDCKINPNAVRTKKISFL